MNNPAAPHPSDTIGEESIPELMRLGEQLGRAREGAGLSLDALARRLRVEPRLLQALEQGDHSQLPEGVFIVALARRIAGTLNTNVEEAVDNVRQSRLMERRVRTKASAAPEAIAPAPLPQRAPQPGRALRRSPGSPWLWPLAGLLVLGGAMAAWLISKPAAPPSPAPEEPAPSLAPKPPGKGSPAPGSGSPAATTSGPAAPAPGADILRLQSSEPSWMEVRDAGGRTLYEGTFSGEKRFPLGQGLEVMAGRPHAVRASIGSSPATPLGGVDDIRWKRFSPQELTPAAPPASPSPTP